MRKNKANIQEAIAKGETSLGIEFGSTRIKAVLIDHNFETIASGSYEWENRLEDGFWTYNLVDIITGLQTAYREMKQEVEQKLWDNDSEDWFYWILSHDAWIYGL